MIINNVPCPELSFNGLPADQQQFTWRLTSGMQPYFTSIIFNINYKDGLEALLGTKGTIKVVGMSITQTDYSHDLEIKNVYLVEIKPFSVDRLLCSFMDVRYELRGKKVSMAYNITRDKNDKVTIDQPHNGDPLQLLNIMKQGKVGRYLPWSVDDKGDPVTMVTILTKELVKITGSLRVSPEINDLDYIQENIIFEASDVYSAFNKLLDMCRMSVHVDLQGEYWIRSIDQGNNPFPINQIEKYRVDPNLYYMTNMEYLRPEYIRVQHRRILETRVQAVDSFPEDENTRTPLEFDNVITKEKYDKWRAIACTNVVKIAIQIGDFSPGEWVPVKTYISLFKIDLTTFLRSFLSGMFVPLYANKLYKKVITLPGYNINSIPQAKKLASLIIGPLYKSYRTTYQIEPYFINRIKNIKNRQVGIVNTYGKQTPLAPVYTNHSVIMTDGNAYFRDTINNFSVSYDVKTEDPNRVKPTPFLTRIVDSELMIFTLEAPPDYQGQFIRIIQSKLGQEIGSPANSATVPILQSVGLSYDHFMEAILSFEFYVDENNDPSVDSNLYYERAYLTNGKGPIMTVLNDIEPARFALDDKTLPSNAGVLDRLDRVETARLINIYKDRYSGLVKLAGFEKDWMPIFHLKDVDFTINVNGSCYTTLDFRYFPPNPSVDQLIDPDILSYVRGHVQKSKKNTQVYKYGVDYGN